MFIHQFKFQVNNVDVSECNHEEAVKKLMEAEEPIVVEVKRRSNITTVNDDNKDKYQPASEDHRQILQSPSYISREVQTEVDTTNNCLRCVDYYDYNDCKSDENLIFPDFEYEVMICKYRLSSSTFKIITVRILQRKEKKLKSGSFLLF